MISRMNPTTVATPTRTAMMNTALRLRKLKNAPIGGRLPSSSARAPLVNAARNNVLTMNDSTVPITLSAAPPPDNSFWKSKPENANWTNQLATRDSRQIAIQAPAFALYLDHP